MVGFQADNIMVKKSLITICYQGHKYLSSIAPSVDSRNTGFSQMKGKGKGKTRWMFAT